MLNFSPSMMSTMETNHLIQALDCEPSIMRTPAELELIKRLDAALDELAEYYAIDARIVEAQAQYPRADFLEALADRVFELGEKLQGDNMDEAIAIAKELTELGLTIANGREELDLILNR